MLWGGHPVPANSLAGELQNSYPQRIFPMIDFSTLPRPKSAAERQRDEDQRVARQVADDLKRRREWSGATVDLILIEDSSRRLTASGGIALHLRGARDNGSPLAVTWFAPDHYTKEEIKNIHHELTEGSRLTIEGYWGSSKADARARATFVAQVIQIGDGPRTP